MSLKLVNPYFIKQLPGRKSDVKDTQWIAECLLKNLIRGSFVPDKTVQDMRKYNHRIFDLNEDLTYNTNKLDAALQRCGFRLSNYVSRVRGKSYQKCVRAIITGTTDPEGLVKLIHGKTLRKYGRNTIKDAVTGDFHQADICLLKQYAELIDVIERQVEECRNALIAMCQEHFPNEYSFQEIVSSLRLPVFVKPANAGSSVGVSKVTNETEYRAALLTAFRFDNKILVEEAVIGKELECGVLGNEEPQASIVGEIVATETFYSYDAKYIHSDGVVLQVPARIEAHISDTIRQLAVKACKAIGCEGMARVDFLLSSENKLVLNEINTLPGFTEISMYPKMWEATGISEKELITILINLAIQRHERNVNLSTEIEK